MTCKEEMSFKTFFSIIYSLTINKLFSIYLVKYEVSFQTIEIYGIAVDHKAIDHN